MCTNGVNAEYFESMVAVVDEYISVSYRWTHKIAHIAADGGFTSASDKIHAAQGLLADARALLDEAKICVDEGVVVSSGVTAKRV